MTVPLRRTGRVLPVHDDRVLLLRGSDPSRPADGAWWFTVGGGCEGDETSAAAARRETFEETGLVLPPDLGPVVLQRTAAFSFEGEWYEQSEDYYLCRVDSAAVSTAGWTDLEQRAVSGYRWWSPAELAATEETVYPDGLAELLTRLLATDPRAPADR